MSSCSACNAPLPADASICSACGASVAGPAPFLADDPWGARPPAPASVAPPPLPVSPSPQPEVTGKGGFPTWAKVAIGIAVALILLGSIGAFLAVRAFRSLDTSDFLTDVSISVTGDVALDGTVIGDCVAGGSPISCASPHELEVFHIIPAAGSAYPSFDELFDASDGECTDAFEVYVGIDYFESDYFLDAYAPSEAAWEAGDRVIRCAAYDPFGDVTGSIRGVAR